MRANTDHSEHAEQPLGSAQTRPSLQRGRGNDHEVSGRWWLGRLRRRSVARRDATPAVGAASETAACPSHRRRGLAAHARPTAEPEDSNACAHRREVVAERSMTIQGRKPFCSVIDVSGARSEWMMAWDVERRSLLE